MTATISRLYDNYTEAQRAVSDLEAAGLSHSDISIVANNSDNWHDNNTKMIDRDHDGVDDRKEGAETGAGIGAGLGGAAGLLTGLGLLAIPGVGPVVAAGWLVATAVGATAGAATGGIVLTQAGTSKDEANIYAEGVRRGGTLVSARVEDASRAQYEAVLDRSAVNVSTRGEAYRKAGWQTFDPASQPYSADQVKKERQTYGNR
jgi:hypothetical protein